MGGMPKIWHATGFCVQYEGVTEYGVSCHKFSLHLKIKQITEFECQMMDADSIYQSKLEQFPIVGLASGAT